MVTAMVMKSRPASKKRDMYTEQHKETSEPQQKNKMPRRWTNNPQLTPL